MNKQTRIMTIDCYNSILNEFGKIDKYLASMIHEPFDWICLPICK